MITLSTLFGKKSDYPNHVEKYLHSFKVFDRKQPYDNYEYFVFDSETTSLDIKKLHLLSVGGFICSVDKISIASEWHKYVINHKNVNHSENVEIHGITVRALEAGEDPKSIIDQFLNIASGRVLVGHHIHFDVSVINKYLAHYYPKLKLINPIIDTKKLAERIEKAPYSSDDHNSKKYSLDELLGRYSIKPIERHTALGDAYTTALLFLKLLALVKKRGIKKLSDIT